MIDESQGNPCTHLPAKQAVANPKLKPPSQPARACVKWSLHNGSIHRAQQLNRRLINRTCSQTAPIEIDLRPSPYSNAIAHALAQANVLLTHGGHSTICQALLAGAPIVLIPRSPETRHTAIAAANAGASVIADKPALIPQKPVRLRDRTLKVRTGKQPMELWDESNDEENNSNEVNESGNQVPIWR